MVVVPVYNAPEWLGPCLDELVRHSRTHAGEPAAYDICFWDDASPEAAVREVLEAAAARHPGLTFERNRGNEGFVGTCNQAFTRFRLSYEYIFLCNSDVLVTAGSIQSGIQLLEADARCALVSFLATQNAQLSLTLPEGVDHEDMNAFLRNEVRLKPIPAMPSVGCLLGVRSGAVADAELFDPVFKRGYGEETELHFRLLDRGWQARVVENAFIYHRGAASFGSVETPPEENYYQFLRRWRQQWDEMNTELRRQDPLAPLRPAGQRALHPELARQLKAFASQRRQRGREEDGKPRAVALYLSPETLEFALDGACHLLQSLKADFQEVIALMDDDAETATGGRLPVRAFSLHRDAGGAWRECLQDRTLEVTLCLDPFSRSGLRSQIITELERVAPRSYDATAMAADALQWSFRRRRVTLCAPDFSIGQAVSLMAEKMIGGLQGVGLATSLVTPSGADEIGNLRYGARSLLTAGTEAVDRLPLQDLLICCGGENPLQSSQIAARQTIWFVPALTAWPPDRAFTPADASPFLLRGITVIAPDLLTQARLEVMHGLPAVVLEEGAKAEDCARLAATRLEALRWQRIPDDRAAAVRLLALWRVSAPGPGAEQLPGASLPTNFKEAAYLNLREIWRRYFKKLLPEKALQGIKQRVNRLFS